MIYEILIKKIKSEINKKKFQKFCAMINKKLKKSQESLRKN